MSGKSIPPAARAPSVTPAVCRVAVVRPSPVLLGKKDKWNKSHKGDPNIPKKSPNHVQKKKPADDDDEEDDEEDESDAVGGGRTMLDWDVKPAKNRMEGYVKGLQQQLQRLIQVTQLAPTTRLHAALVLTFHGAQHPDGTCTAIAQASNTGTGILQTIIVDGMPLTGHGTIVLKGSTQAQLVPYDKDTAMHLAQAICDASSNMTAHADKGVVSIEFQKISKHTREALARDAGVAAEETKQKLRRVRQDLCKKNQDKLQKDADAINKQVDTIVAKARKDIGST
eukprot:gene9098-1635_t